MARNTHSFETIRSEGGLLPPDLLRRVLDPKSRIPGTEPEDYGLAKGERLNEAITQSWNRLRRHWVAFRESARGLPESEPAEKLTNDKWNIPVLQELDFGMLPTGAGPEVGGRTYAIKRFFGPTAVHLVGCGVSLDKRAAGVRGAAMSNPHGLVQEFLNRSEGYLWAIVSNGLRFRILRDNQALSRQSYLEFDLEAMFDGEVYSDFVLFWLFGHATRFAVREEGRPETCWLEQWSKLAEEQGTRALQSLRVGVQEALQILGQGFVGHSKNTQLREALRTGQLSLPDFHGELLRVVYRFIFLFVAEDRRIDNLSLLHTRDASEEGRLARERYAAYYSTRRLRDMAAQIKGSRHGDLWRQFQMVVGALSGSDATAAMRQHLALPALGSMLWNPASTGALNAPADGKVGTELANYDLLEAIRRLAFTRQDKVLRPVDYANLGAEELGGVYESLLALSPQISGDGASFTFAEFAGNERKTSGSYYTPDSLVQCLLDSALDPVVEAAIKGKSNTEAAKVILALKVCDPAVGSGHFLVGAAHRLARHLARVRALAQGESEPSPLLYQHALRDIIGRCLYGVDINPMAAELCRVSLWLEALEPGKPLSFLDHHIRVGNSLLGAKPELIEKGIPDAAFEPIEGDDKKICAALKKRNKQESGGQQDMLHKMVAEPKAEYLSLAERMLEMAEVDEVEVAAVHEKESKFKQLVESPEYCHARVVADAWCAAFVWKKTKDAPAAVTTDVLRGLQADLTAMPLVIRTEVERLAAQYHFFHWHLAFPEVFARGGFDCVLGNPPWEMIQLDDAEYFSSIESEIAPSPTTAKRKQAIQALADSAPTQFMDYQNEMRHIQATQHFIHDTGLFPLTSSGRLNSAPLFCEQACNLTTSLGRAGLIAPTSVITTSFTQAFFSSLVTQHRLVSLYDFENSAPLFQEVHRSYKFSLMTIAGQVAPVPGADFAFYCTDVGDLAVTGRRFRLSPSQISLLNPNTTTCPVFRSARDVCITIRIYERLPVLLREPILNNHTNPWSMRFVLMFMMNTASHLFRSASEIQSDGWTLTGNQFAKAGKMLLPLYEGKMIWQFNHRAASVEYKGGFVRGRHDIHGTREEQLEDPAYLVMPRMWVADREVAEAVGATASYFVCFRDITNASAERTCIFTVIPWSAVGNSLPILLLKDKSSLEQAVFVAEMNSFIADYVARQKIPGNHLNYYILKQLPHLLPHDYVATAWIDVVPWLPWFGNRALELLYTTWDLVPFAQDCGWSGPPFRWDEDRRFLLRCELDSAFFHLYLPATPEGGWKPSLRTEGAVHDETPEQRAELQRHFPTPRSAVSYILDTFPIVKRKDEAKYGTYRTKDTILEIYDAMAVATHTGQPYQTRVSPAPASIRAAHVFDWERNPLAVPDEPRAAFHVAANYAPTVMLEMMWQNNGVIRWELMRRAWELLCEPDDLAKKAYAGFGVLAAKWRKRYCDRLDRNDLVDTLSGFCHDGTLRMYQSDGERVIELCKEERYAFFADVRCDARIALAVAATLPEVREAREDARLAELVALGSR